MPRTVVAVAAGVVILGACSDAAGVEDGRCAGRVGDPSIATSCVAVQGTVVGPGSEPLRAAFVTVDCFGAETQGCGAVPGRTEDDGAYRLVVHDLRRGGGPGFVVIRADDPPSGLRARSDTIPVRFVPMGDLYPVYIRDLRATADVAAAADGGG